MDRSDSPSARHMPQPMAAMSMLVTPRIAAPTPCGLQMRNLRSHPLQRTLVRALLRKRPTSPRRSLARAVGQMLTRMLTQIHADAQTPTRMNATNARVDSSGVR